MNNYNLTRTFAENNSSYFSLSVFVSSIFSHCDSSNVYIARKLRPFEETKFLSTCFERLIFQVDVMSCEKVYRN